MALILNEDQLMLKDMAKGFLAEKAPVSELRRLRDEADENGYSKELWAEMAEMGWTGVVVPEEFGGIDFGYVGAGVILEEMGRNLTASPFFSTAILGATLLSKFGSDAQKQDLLPKLVEGNLITALACDERSRHAPSFIQTRAEQSGNGFKLSGAKTFVLDGHVADKLIVAARTSGEDRDEAGITLFIVDPKSDGVEVERSQMVDDRNAARVTLNDVQVSGDDVLGEIDGGFKALNHALDAGRICLSAEMLGMAQESMERTVEYLKEREQFGKIIGTFQGLQHRAAHLFSEVEVTRSAVLKGLQSLDADDPLTAHLSSMIKAKAGQTAVLAGNEGVQMHGGIGMTDEFDIGFYMKRARVAQESFGDAAFHSDRLAKLAGY